MFRPRPKALNSSTTPDLRETIADYSMRGAARVPPTPALPVRLKERLLGAANGFRRSAILAGTATGCVSASASDLRTNKRGGGGMGRSD